VESSQLGSRRRLGLLVMPCDRTQLDRVRSGFAVDEGANWIRIFNVLLAIVVDHLKLEERVFLQQSFQY
jgi:hypothetical protein